MENRFAVLTGNQLKLIAAAAMLLDHAGILLFPHIRLFRILGRLAYPIFAYMIAEGCRYTRNKLWHFSMLFGLGAGCQLVYYFFQRGYVPEYPAHLFCVCAADLCSAGCLRNPQAGIVVCGICRRCHWSNRIGYAGYHRLWLLGHDDTGFCGLFPGKR